MRRLKIPVSSDIDCLTLRSETPRYFKISLNIYQSIRRNITQYLNLQQYRC